MSHRKGGGVSARSGAGEVVVWPTTVHDRASIRQFDGLISSSTQRLDLTTFLSSD